VSDTHPRYIVAPDRLAEPPAYAVVDTQGDNGDNPQILCATTDAFASRIAAALNDWGKCDRLHHELHRMGVAREELRQRTADEMASLRSELHAALTRLADIDPAPKGEAPKAVDR